MMDTRWKLYQGALLWDGNPATDTPTQEEAKEAVRESGAMFARWTSHWDCGTPTEWYSCIRDHFTPIEQVSVKQRYRINKGLRNTSIELISIQDIPLHIEDIYNVAQLAFADYPKQYRPIIKKEDYEHWLSNFPDNQDLWICREITTKKIIGYAVCEYKYGFINLQQVKVPTIYLNSEANAAFIYCISQYYLQKEHIRYITDGERNIKHQTQYQDYLMRIHGFRLAYSQLHIEYSPRMRIAVNLLYPLRGGVRLLGKFNSFAYNVYCALKMEQIRRSFK